MKLEETNDLVLEACVENLSQAVTAEKMGADRIELCGRLDLDGLTPDDELIVEVMDKLDIPVKVMVRNRAGGFIYHEDEIKDMIHTIHRLKSMGVSEIVTGALTTNNQLDIAQIKSLAEAADPMIVTIHKCIDEVSDPIEAIHALKAIPNVKYILTSGKAKTAIEGMSMLNRMIEAGGNRITIIAAGKITPRVLPQLIANLGPAEYHGKKIVHRNEA